MDESSSYKVTVIFLPLLSLMRIEVRLNLSSENSHIFLCLWEFDYSNVLVNLPNCITQRKSLSLYLNNTTWSELNAVTYYVVKDELQFLDICLNLSTIVKFIQLVSRLKVIALLLNLDLLKLSFIFKDLKDFLYGHVQINQLIDNLHYTKS